MTHKLTCFEGNLSDQGNLKFLTAEDAENAEHFIARLFKVGIRFYSI
jgi:hypothetical protein